jgi:hypothetical protein
MLVIVIPYALYLLSHVIVKVDVSCHRGNVWFLCEHEIGHRFGDDLRKVIVHERHVRSDGFIIEAIGAEHVVGREAA